MRRTLPILIGLLIVTAVSALAVTHGNNTLLLDPARKLGEIVNDTPVRANLGGARADTTWYGDYQIIGGVYYARSATLKSTVDWTFDRGNGPTGDPNVLTNGEGWKAEDLTANTVMYFRVIDNTLNLGGPAAPIIDGAKSLWVGADKPQSDALCWCGGAGYGNNWCQRITSESLAYNGTGSVTLSLKYFNHTEPCYDGTQIYLKRADNTELMLNPYPAGTCTDNLSFAGGFTDSIGSWQPAGGVHPGPATYTRAITTDEIGGTQNIKIIIEFSSDGGASDEDCGGGSTVFQGTIWGPFGADDITINGGGISKSYTFETGLQNWTPGFCTPKGLYTAINDVGNYTILDPCGCRLSGNIMSMHAGVGDAGTHPVGQHVMAESPICDNSSNHNLKDIFMEFDMYAIMPRENGVAIRPGWRYYPWTCDLTGAVGWSPRVGQDAYNYLADANPTCGLFRYGGTNVSGTPVPPDAQQVIATMELLACCDCFTIANCTGVTNATPLFDNLAVGITTGAVAPSIAFENGMNFSDHGSYPSNLYDPRAVGPADVDLTRYIGDPPNRPRIGGDSLTVAGPNPGSDPNKRWEARMWWRVARRSPFNSDKANGANTLYKQWRDAVSDGKQIDRPYKPEFCFGWMDSVQNGTIPLRNKFKSEFRENDDDFVGEGQPHNEMIWDDVLYPGTRIDYFVTSNYIGTPNLLGYLPDTTGQFYCEFEILPGDEVANVANCGGTGFNYCVYHPATLYIDAHNGGSQIFIENALRTVLNGLPSCTDENGCVIPYNRNWDRYDYKDSSSNFNCPFGRSTVAGSNNGMTPQQIEGYRAILLETGNLGSGTLEEEDFPVFDSWLRTHLCGFDPQRRVFVFNGDEPGTIMTNYTNGTSFLTNTLGATLFCSAFNGNTIDPNCSPQETAYCVRWLPVGGGAYGTTSDIDLYGNWCPNQYAFNVYQPLTGTPNRYFQAEGGKTMQYAQIVNQDISANNYRTVLDGGAWNHMTSRNASGSPTYCPTDFTSVVSASLGEIGAALRWGFGVANNNQIPTLVSAQDVATCEGTWTGFPSDVGGDQTNAYVNRLYQNAPNPFNPRTAIKFSLAQSGPVTISIYDVNGRLVKTLVKGVRSAGTYTEVWDGTNDLGKKVGSGVFWSQMKTGSYVSNKKMVILK